ncbi:MAG: succinate dehydrogenase, cytochrome b556 subunit [Dokdonella sp.]
MQNPARPLSPHLQVYRRQVQMVTSILHRATGVVLSVGSLLIAYGLIALASGNASWDELRNCAASWLGLIVLIGWSWALSFHLINGIRHLLQDAGWGYAIKTFVRNSWISVIGSLLLTVAIWAIVIAHGGFA